MTKQQNKKEAIERLKEVIKKGDTLFTQLQHVSQSGMMRHIKVRQLKNDRPLDWTYLVSNALDWKVSDKTRGIRVGGCGMDMAFSVVNHLQEQMKYNSSLINFELKHRII